VDGPNGSHAITFRLRVDGLPIQGVDYLQLDEEGLVRRITVTMRPLASLQALAERMAETVANLAASQAEENPSESYVEPGAAS
jgi:hypothetical protein